MDKLGTAASGPGRIYLTGGATALLLGWRDTTIDVDLKLDPEPAGAFEAIARLKNELDVNIELASPDQFIPPPRGWQDRSVYIGTHGSVDFYHFDFYAQALAKIERGHARDLDDVRAMIRLGVVTPLALPDLFETLRPGLVRYPGIDANAFEAKLARFLSDEGHT
jgi:hypothetical protein